MTVVSHPVQFDRAYRAIGTESAEPPGCCPTVTVRCWARRNTSGPRSRPARRRDEGGRPGRFLDRISNGRASPASRSRLSHTFLAAASGRSAPAGCTRSGETAARWWRRRRFATWRCARWRGGAHAGRGFYLPVQPAGPRRHSRGRLPGRNGWTTVSGRVWRSTPGRRLPNLSGVKTTSYEGREHSHPGWRPSPCASRAVAVRWCGSGLLRARGPRLSADGGPVIAGDRGPGGCPMSRRGAWPVSDRKTGSSPGRDEARCSNFLPNAPPPPPDERRGRNDPGGAGPGSTRTRLAGG